METFSALLALCEGKPPITGGFPSQRPVTRGLLFSLIYPWTNGWANDRDAGDWRHHHVHYDVTVMWNPDPALKCRSWSCCKSFPYSQHSFHASRAVIWRKCLATVSHRVRIWFCSRRFLGAIHFDIIESWATTYSLTCYPNTTVSNLPTGHSPKTTLNQTKLMFWYDGFYFLQSWP